MAQLRWFSKRFKVSADEIRLHAMQKGTVFAQAKHELEKRSQPILQFFDPIAGMWIDVPFVEQIIDPQSGLSHEQARRGP